MFVSIMNNKIIIFFLTILMKRYFTLLATLILALNTFGQVGVNTTTPDASSALDITSTTGGLLPPRMTTTQRDAISSAAIGLVLFNTTLNTLQINVGDASTANWVNLSSDTSTTYSIGDFAHGGIVFWVDETGQHGLVCAKEDQSTGVRWYAGTNGNTQAKGDGPYSGEENTLIIISAQVPIGDDGSTYAARICNELQISEGGKTYGDWYLPSKEELNIMYHNKTTIEATAFSNGGDGFFIDIYWSSTEYEDDAAWTQSFYDGSQSLYYKDTTSNVRAVRAF